MLMIRGSNRVGRSSAVMEVLTILGSTQNALLKGALLSHQQISAARRNFDFVTWRRHYTSVIKPFEYGLSGLTVI
jgi:hypothetical protein